MMAFFSLFGGGLAGVGKRILGSPSLIALILVSLSFAAVTISKNAEISTLRKDINDPTTGWIARYDAEQRNNETLRNNNATLAASLTLQSQSINALAAQGKAAGDKFDQLIAAQAGTREKLRLQSAALDAAQPGADKCASASSLVRSMVQ